MGDSEDKKKQDNKDQEKRVLDVVEAIFVNKLIVRCVKNGINYITEHKEDDDVTKGMFTPELVVAESGRSDMRQRGRREEGKKRAGEEPEIGNVKQPLCFADHHVAAKDDRPAADRDGEVVNRVRTKRRDSDKTPVI